MEYKFKKVEEHGYVILEDGHTMFPDDVIKCFERLNFLEKERAGNVPEANVQPQLCEVRALKEQIKMYKECFELFIPSEKWDEATKFLSTYGSGLAKDILRRES